jgi:malate dehydrogenase (oxaloacetate-decarboxylating)(NADP+)
MEGKGVLFKKFAGIDVFDIEIDCQDPERFIDIVRSLEPTFGAVNLEDIKAPECFIIEEKLREYMNIPVMHDDQHGTAIISGAALLNALEIVKKKIEKVKFVISGAGAAAISCAKIYVALGAKRENMVMIDVNGVIHKNREDINKYQKEFATDRNVNNLSEAIESADVFIGLSAGGVLKPEMVLKMAKDPIVFALANPVPEIDYNLAIQTRKDIIIATGRSDHPNQVNNVLGFPYIFRGALDVRAVEINEAMKLAAVRALSDLAKEPVPEIVNKAYADEKLIFGRNYLIPKPVDPRLITMVSPAVAKAAMDSGMAKQPILDWDKYHLELQKRIGIDNKMMSRIISQARQNPKKVVFAEGDNYKILKAAQILKEEGIGEPILLGNYDKIQRLIKEYSLDLEDCKILNPFQEKERRERFGEAFFEKRQRKGMTRDEAIKTMRDRNYFGAMMLELGEADALINGLTKEYASSIKPALQAIGVGKNVNRVAGMYIIMNKRGTFFFSDTTINENPTAPEMVEIIGLTAKAVKFFGVDPKIAVLSYSNFGSSKGVVPEKAACATRLAKDKYPDLVIDGEIQANIALDTKLQKEIYPFSAIAEEGANTFIFPDLASGNIAYKLLQELGGAEAIGPILMGMSKPVHILQLGSSVREIVNMAAIAVVDAQNCEKNLKL